MASLDFQKRYLEFIAMIKIELTSAQVSELRNVAKSLGKVSGNDGVRVRRALSTLQASTKGELTEAKLRHLYGRKKDGDWRPSTAKSVANIGQSFGADVELFGKLGWSDDVPLPKMSGEKGIKLTLADGVSDDFDFGSDETSDETAE